MTPLHPVHSNNQGAATNRKKRQASRTGRQFVANTRAAARASRAARRRRVP